MVVNILGEGVCCNGRGSGVKEEVKVKGEVGGWIVFIGI